MKEFSLAKNSGVTIKAPLNYPKPSQRQDVLNTFLVCYKQS